MVHPLDPKTKRERLHPKSPKHDQRHAREFHENVEQDLSTPSSEKKFNLQKNNRLTDHEIHHKNLKEARNISLRRTPFSLHYDQGSKSPRRIRLEF